MADVDIDPFGEHKSRPEKPTDENIPLDPVTARRINLGTGMRARNIIWRRVSKKQTNERLC